MSRILVLYSTFDGQTAKIAQRIGFALADHGHTATLRTSEAPDARRELERCDAVIVGGGIRYGHHAKSLVEFVSENLAAIEARPSAFYSVSLSSRDKTPEKQAVARRYATEFRSRTGWYEGETVLFAGALPYSRYNPFLRFLMKLIAAAAGSDTDTSRDYEYTDWQAVDRFAIDFAAHMAMPVAA